MNLQREISIQEKRKENKMKIKKEPITYPCDKCGGEHKITGTVNINSSNPWHLYKTSKRPFQYRNRVRLCKKHFAEFNTKLCKLIYDY